MTPKKENARGKAGKPITKRAGGVKGKNKVVKFTHYRISKLLQELLENGVGLRNALGDTQLATLPKALAYLGDRGLATYEGTAAGYARLATRIQNLEEDGWLIESQRENVIGPDGLFHPQMARYVLRGRKTDIVNPQGSLDLGWSA